LQLPPLPTHDWVRFSNSLRDPYESAGAIQTLSSPGHRSEDWTSLAIGIHSSWESFGKRLAAYRLRFPVTCIGKALVEHPNSVNASCRKRPADPTKKHIPLVALVLK
jgi:hypothetical protein